MANIDEAKDKLEGILSKREYQIYYEDNRNFLEIWWDKAKGWFMEQLAKLFQNFEPSSGLADIMMIGIIVIVIVLVGLGIFLAVRSNRRKRKFRDHQPLSSRSEMNWSFNNHLSAADEQESQQNYRSATRHMFLALLLYFHENGWLEAKSWKTNWEYYAELKKLNQQRADQFYNLALLFDEVVYGEHIMGQDEYLLYKEAAMTWLNQDESAEPSDG